jgi:CheY-like chemotaxis protein
MKMKTWKVITNTGKQADLESGLEKKEVQTKTFQTEDAALDYLVSQRWPSGVRCLGCDCVKVYRIDTKGKTGRPYRKYECSDCGLHFSATTGTLFHDSHLPLQKWFMTMALMAEAKKGISAELASMHLVDVVIVDYLMPEMNGQEIAMKLRRLMPDFAAFV